MKPSGVIAKRPVLFGDDPVAVDNDEASRFLGGDIGDGFIQRGFVPASGGRVNLVRLGGGGGDRGVGGQRKRGKGGKRLQQGQLSFGDDGTPPGSSG